MYISVPCHISSHNRYKGFGVCTSSASGIHNYQRNILVQFGFCDFESRVIILTFFCLRLGVAFRETIFSLTMATEKVRKFKKHSNPRWWNKLKFICNLFWNATHCTASINYGRNFNFLAFQHYRPFCVTFADLVSPADYVSSVSVSLETPPAFSSPSNEIIFFFILNTSVCFSWSKFIQSTALIIRHDGVLTPVKYMPNIMIAPVWVWGRSVHIGRRMRIL